MASTVSFQLRFSVDITTLDEDTCYLRDSSRLNVRNATSAPLAYSQDSWHDPRGDMSEGSRGEIFSHHKRQMFPNHNIRRRMPEGLQQRPRELKKKSSSLPVIEDDFYDDTVSIPLGPPPQTQTKHYETYEKPIRRTQNTVNSTKPKPAPAFAVNLIKEVLNQLAKEFITRQVDEEFVFGQYVGNAMRNLKGDYKIKMQHDLLDIIVKYQLLNRGDKLTKDNLKINKERRIDGQRKGNETDDWSDFSNLEKIMKRD